MGADRSAADQDEGANPMNEHPGRLFRPRSAGGLALSVLALAMVCCGPALAQSGRAGTLTDRIERLERELRTLRRAVPRGGAPTAAVSNTQFAATVEIRLSEMEVLIRGLERRIESLEIAERRARSRSERVATDLEHRLRGLERGQTPPGAAAGAATAPAPAPAGAATIIGGTTAPDASPRPLGTLRLSGSGQPAATPARPAPTLPEGGPKEQYDHALSLIRDEQDFAKAEKAFAAFIARHPKHALAGNAYFWLGQTHFVREDFQNAAFAFADGFQRFPRGEKAPENLYKLGASLGRLGKTQEACVAFRQLLETFPKAGRTLKSRIARERKRLKCR